MIKNKNHARMINYFLMILSSSCFLKYSVNNEFINLDLLYLHFSKISAIFGEIVMVNDGFVLFIFKCL
jgi:hypothetical protein